MTTTLSSSQSFYAKVDDAQREKLLQAYVDFLIQKNGQLDPPAVRL